MSKELRALIIKINKSHWKTEEEKNEINHCIDVIKERELKAQELEKALRIIFEKEVDIEYIKKETTTFEDYNKWVEFVDSMGVNIPKNRNRQLTQEEFDLLKRYLNGK